MMSGQMLFRGLVISLAVACLCATEALAGIGASEDVGNSSTTTEYNGGNGGFEIIEDVTYDPGAGPWIKQLINNPSGGPIVSGFRVNIMETLTNTGTRSWTDWHEEILTDTLINGFPERGFLFDKNFLNLMADYGNGFQPLAEITDYTVMGMDYVGPGSSNENMGLEAIWIFFEPHAVIQTGDTLKIEKQIFEVHLDANVWQPGEFVEIAQYPTIPEPSSILLAAASLVFLACRRRKHP